jgi:hypothetical protein
MFSYSEAASVVKREAYLVKHRSFAGSDISRVTSNAVGLFPQPARSGASPIPIPRRVEPCFLGRLRFDGLNPVIRFPFSASQNRTT